MDDTKNIYIIIFLIFIPLLCLVLFYKYYINIYVLKQCNATRLETFTNKKESKEIKSINNKDTLIEGFFGGLNNWFTTNVGNMPISPGTLGDESLSILEKKISAAKTSSSFPPTNSDLSGTSDDFKESNNKDLLGSINSKALEKPFLTQAKDNAVTINKEGKFKDIPIDNTVKPIFIPNDSEINIDINKNQPEPNNIVSPPTLTNDSTSVSEINSQKNPSESIKNLFGSCQFFNDQCPKDYVPLGNFSVQGTNSSSYILNCGNVQNTSPAKVIAEIKNNSIYDIHIIDKGRGYAPAKPPKVTITGGGGGTGASAEAVIDDDGYLALIKITDKGHSYSETPNVLIDPPLNDSSCHLCCKI
jgi:hypothetical protein